MENLYPFGATFKYLREARGLSLKEAASDIVSPQFLSQFVKGDKGISLENFAKLLIVIGVEWNDFVLAYANKGGDCLELPAIEFGMWSMKKIFSLTLKNTKNYLMSI